jgi:hypothetical protein
MTVAMLKVAGDLDLPRMTEKGRKYAFASGEAGHSRMLTFECQENDP